MANPKRRRLAAANETAPAATKPYRPPVLPSRRRIAAASIYDRHGTPYPRAITPESVRNMLLAAASGRPRAQNDFIDQMLEADLTLAGIYETRVGALTGKEWEVVVDETGRSATASGPGANADRSRAEDIAAWVSDRLAKAAGLDDALTEQADAIGRSYALTETIWDSDGREFWPAALIPVPRNAVEGDVSDPSIVCVHTDKNSSPGEPIATHPFKFALHAPRRISGNVFRGGLLRRAAPVHLYRRYGLKWWTSFIEMFGTPYRMLKYPKTATDDMKAELLEALEAFGHLGYGIFPPESELEFVMTTKGDPNGGVHGALLDKIDGWYAISFLGQNLTTNVEGGSFAAAEVHDRVRGDILRSDVRAESATVTGQIIKPMVRLTFGADAPIPIFRRRIEKPKDTAAAASILDIAVNRLGMEIPYGHAAAMLGGLPIPDGIDANDPLPGAPAAADPMAPPGAPSPFSNPPARPALSRRVPPRLAKKTSPVAILKPWTDEIVAQSGKQARRIAATMAGAMESVSNIKQAAAHLETGVELVSGHGEAFADFVADFLLASALAGVYNAEKQLGRGPARATLANEPSFETQPYRQAIGALRDRLLLPPDQFMALERDARSRAGRIAGEYNLAVVKDAYAAIETQLETGGTVRDFKRAIQTLPAKDGWAGENTWHANVVFQQNSMMAYHSAHLQRFEAAGVQHWKYRGYDTSCQICSEIIKSTNGKAFAMDDLRFYPPVHFNCDCWAEPVLDSPKRVVASNTVNAPAYDESQAAPSAFRYNPRQFAKMEPFDLTGVPQLLKSAFRKFAEAAGWETKG